jgi:hypothetical protein
MDIIKVPLWNVSFRLRLYPYSNVEVSFVAIVICVIF